MPLGFSLAANSEMLRKGTRGSVECYCMYVAEHISTATLSKTSSCNAFASLLQRNAKMASTSQQQVVPQEDSEDQQVLFPLQM
jgi:hypothetical protein